ncbi:MAG: respiratory nitrate reductase subunit gamma [Desulfobacteraceae bacterium]|nr:respiratory nitrate reductase subunit gamma [Desulfobacteraceae bacterium]
MHSLYQFVSGPMVWIAFIVFIGGSLYRVAGLIMMANKKEKFIFSYMNLKYGLRSILHWIIPFGATNMRKKPFTTIVSFAFHICLLIAPLFLLSHIILIDESWNISWFALSDSMADFMTLIVIAGCIFFLIRRRVLPEVRFLTSVSDYVILTIVAAPFITGFLAYHQWFGYQFFLILHILSGEIMLMAIPFTRLSHMLFAVFTRAYMGSEFGLVRHARDW